MNYVAKLLDDHDCKKTKAKLAIVKILKESNKPISVKDIYERINEKETHVNLSTVYRALEVMDKKNVVVKIKIEDDLARYCLKNDAHKHYLICNECKLVIPIKNCPVKSAEMKMASDNDFKITAHRLEFYGVCSKCKNKRRGK